MNGEIFLLSSSNIIEIKSLFSSVLTDSEDLEISPCDCSIYFLRLLFSILYVRIVNFNLSNYFFEIGAFRLAGTVVIFAF